MGNVFHKNFTLDDNHALTARLYADIAARDADTAFQVTANIDKLVRVTAPAVDYHSLLSVGPTVWSVGMLGGDDTLAEILVKGNTTGGTDLIISTGDDLLVTDHMTVGSAVAPAASTSIDLTSTTAAFLFNRLTTTQRDALTPSEGMVIWNTTTKQAENYDGTSWVFMSGGDVSGPVSSTNDALVRMDGTTGKLIQNSLAILDDLGNLGTVTSLAIGVATADNLLDVHSASANAVIAITSLGTDTDPVIKFELTDDLATFSMGVDDSDGDKFKIGVGGIQVNTRFTIDSAGLIGIGTDAPNNLLDIHSATLEAALAITSLGTDTDPLIKFELADGTATFTMGVDDSDGDKFKIGTTGLSPTRITIDNTGLVGIGTATPDTRLHVQGTSSGTAEIRITTDTDTVGEVSTLAFSIPAGDPQSGMKGTSRSAGVMDLALFVQSAATPGNRFDALTILGLTGFVGIGDTIPDNLLDVHSVTGQSAIAITSLTADLDALIKFEVNTDNVAEFSIGVDDSDADKFKIGTTALDASTRLTIDSSGNVGIATTTPTTPLEVDGIVTLTANSANHLFLGSMDDGTGDGGRIILDGSGSNDTWLIDSFFQDLRIFPTSGNVGFVRIFNGDGGSAGLKVEGNTQLGSPTDTPLSTLDIEGTLGFKRVGTGSSISTSNEIIIGVTDTSAVRTITLQTADAIAGRIYIIKDESGAAGTNNIIIATQGSETIDGDGTLVIASNYGGVMLYSDNVNWFSIAKT